MPAIAQLARVKFSGTSLVRSLRSRLLGSPGKSKSGGGSSDGQAKTPTPVTFSAIQNPRRKKYFELTDSALLKSQGNTILGDRAEDGEEQEEVHEMQSIPSSTHREAKQGVQDGV